VPFSIERYTDERRHDLRALLTDPSLLLEFEWLVQRGELDDPTRHPFGDRSGAWIARADGRPAGFCVLLVMPSKRGTWAMARIGVASAFRRRRLGSALLEAVERRLASLPAERRPGELRFSAWLPSDSAPGFAAHHGFKHSRYMWSMERLSGELGNPRWPPAIEVRSFDGSEQGLQDWNDCSNRAFAASPLTVLSTVEDCRALTRASHFRADGLLLAYRGETCVGFCRNALHPDHAEVDVLGVAPEARGIGLGRSLLRWGVAWLERQNVARVRLMVDGENDSAIRLYRSEGFETIRTRELWARPIAVEAEPFSDAP
jgi:mycothiol synthase